MDHPETDRRLSTRLLPEEFADLERFAGRWSLSTEPERWAQRPSGSLSPHGAYRAPSPSFAAKPTRWTFPVAPLGISGAIRMVLGTLKAASRSRT